ncbi:MAG: hypothetical protein ACP5GS_06320, partial [Nitrososphaeria archaeon]
MKIVYVECKPDHTLARKLLHKDADIVHSGNKSGVISALLKERQNCHKEAVGMIDDNPDSPQPAQLKSLFMDDQKFESMQHLYVKTRELPQPHGWGFSVHRRACRDMRNTVE